MTGTWWVATDELDADQRKIIDLPLEGNHLIVGPPGSGKTNLLLLRANYMYLAGKRNILIVVYTRTLREFMAAGSHQYDFPNSKISTSHAWARRLLFQYGVKVDLPDDFRQVRQLLIERVANLIAEHNLSDIYDVILLDESQDYLPEEIRVFGVLGKSLYAVADSRQKIYDSEDPLPVLRSLTNDEHCLRYHYRNGLKICRLADALRKDSEDYEPLADSSNYDEKARPSSLELVSEGDFPSQIGHMLERLTLQLKTYPGETLGVICPRKDDVAQVWEQVSKSSLATVSVLEHGGHHSPFTEDTSIVVATLHAVKGLEFRALHFAGCEHLRKFPNQRNMAYTAVTRAKTSLSIYYTAELPGFFEGAVATLGPEPDLPSVDDAFGRK